MRRSGLSLLEVVLALAILGVSLGVIGELIRLGTRAGQAARDDTDAQLLCESLINEIAAGAQLPEMVAEQPLDPLGEWLYSVEAQPIDQAGLLGIRVSVRRADATLNEGPAFSLIRWIVDPSVELAAREQEAALEEEMADRAAAEQSAAQASGGPQVGSTGDNNSGSPPSDNADAGNNSQPPPGSGDRPMNRPDLKLPPGVDFPRGLKLPPDGRLPPGIELPPGFDPNNLRPPGGGRGGRGGGARGGGGGRGR